MDKREAARAYWKSNRMLIILLLSIWFLVSFVFSIFLAEGLYTAKIGHLPASFWWAQQGAIMVFVILIFVYAFSMDRLDRKYGVGDDEGGDR
jgi:putative solute:sodium symporter small subunit